MDFKLNNQDLSDLMTDKTTMDISCFYGIVSNLVHSLAWQHPNTALTLSDWVTILNLRIVALQASYSIKH
jgi:hypothetical protein